MGILLLAVEGVDSQSAPSWATERSMLLESISSFFGTLHGDHNKAASVRTAVR